MKVFVNGILRGETNEGRSPSYITRNNNYIGRSNWAGDQHFEVSGCAVGLLIPFPDFFCVVEIGVASGQRF